MGQQEKRLNRILTDEQREALTDLYRAGEYDGGGSIMEGIRTGKHKSKVLKEGQRPDLPPPPSMFQRDVPIVGDQEVARLGRELVDLDPRTKQRISSINVGPTRGAMDYLGESGFKAHEYSGTNLLGLLDEGDRSISLNPKLRDTRFHDYATRNYLGPVLAHEVAHASGHSENEAGKAEYIMGNPVGEAGRQWAAWNWEDDVKKKRESKK